MIRMAFAMAAAACLTAAPLSAQEATGRTLLWSDEFDGLELDREKWGAIGTEFWVNEKLRSRTVIPASRATSITTARVIPSRQ